LSIQKIQVILQHETEILKQQNLIISPPDKSGEIYYDSAMGGARVHSTGWSERTDLGLPGAVIL
jgi:hypothetical protein